ncbi:MAG: tail fiber domain-containing protein [Chloroflexota bacterium]
MIQAQSPAFAQTPSDSLLTQAAIGTGFTYQGQLMQGDTAVNGSCNLTFKLYDAFIFGTQVGSDINNPSVTVNDGQFSIKLDFGEGAFNGEARYLSITINSCNGAGPTIILVPRIALNPTPYALALPGLWTQQNVTSPNIIAGHHTNTISATVYGSTISGGGNIPNSNQILNNYGTIGGGVGNMVDGNIGTIGGGLHNTVNEQYGTISGGRSHTVGGGYGTISGGINNTVNNWYGTISGGSHNIVSGNYATVPGGRSNSALGNYSFAAGYRAKANADGCFVWADSYDGDVTCSIANAFYARARGGVRFYTNSSLTTGVTLAAGGGSWSSISDRAAKENFVPVDGQAILAEVVAMPIESWNYIAQDPSIRHMGPMAQDFHAAFGLGVDNKHINTIDADGVALAAIQGLNQKVETVETENELLVQANTQLRADLAEMEARLAALEALIGQEK